MIEPSATFSHVEGVLAQQAHGETVLLRLSDGSYYALDEVGAVVWERCDGQTTIEGMVVSICEDFEADPETVRRDVVELLGELVGEGLLTSTARDGSSHR